MSEDANRIIRPAEALQQLNVSQEGLIELLRHGILARPGKCGWLQSDIDEAKRMMRN